MLTEDQSASLSASVRVRYGQLTGVSGCVQCDVRLMFFSMFFPLPRVFQHVAMLSKSSGSSDERTLSRVVQRVKAGTHTPMEAVAAEPSLNAHSGAERESYIYIRHAVHSLHAEDARQRLPSYPRPRPRADRRRAHQLSYLPGCKKVSRCSSSHSRLAWSLCPWARYACGPPCGSRCWHYAARRQAGEESSGRE